MGNELATGVTVPAHRMAPHGPHSPERARERFSAVIDRSADNAQPVVAVIPAYNEERFIGSVVLGARSYVDRVIVVDDGSTDATAELAEAAGATIVRHTRNLGKGVALNTGFRAAREAEPAALVVLDGDGQHLPADLPSILAPVLRGEADIVVGSRYLEAECCVPRHRALGHCALNLITSAISGVCATDSQSGFRAFSPRAVEALGFRSSGFAVESEMQFLAHDYHLRVAEVPITVDYRLAAKRPVMAHGMMVLNGMLQLIGQYRPLLFFSVPGLAALLFVLGWGTWLVQVYQDRQTPPLGHVLICVLLSNLGSLALFTGIILHSVRGLLLDMKRPRPGE